MQQLNNLAQYALDALKRHGADDALCYILSETQTEANLENGEFSLLRTFTKDSVVVKSVSGCKASEAVATLLTKEAIDEAVNQCTTRMKLAKPDEFEQCDDPPQKQSFVSGTLEPDVDSMLRNISECVDYQAAKPHRDPLDNYILTHRCKNEVCLKSNGTELQSRLGYYSGGTRSNLFMPNLDQSFAGFGEADLPFDEALRKETSKPLGERFEGSIIFTPRYLRLYWWLSYLVIFNPDATVGENDCPKHHWADKFGEQVASSCFNLSNRPLDDRVCNASPFTREGYLARNAEIVKDGVLNELLYPGRYARKLGRLPNISPVDHESDEALQANIFIEPGQRSIKQIIKDIDKGILVFTLPGAIPHNEEGAFSGIVRGGMLIENGAVTRPVDEVMVTGNYFEMQKNIRGISSEHVVTGGDLTPWIAFDGISVM